MLRVFGRRVLYTIPMLFAISFFVFVAIDVAPGDAAIKAAGENATPETIRATRHELGLDRPLIVRYGSYLGDAVRGDLGTSLSTQEDVSDMITQRLPVTISLAAMALVFGLSGGVLLGLLCARRPNGAIDRLLSGVCSLAVASPPFVIGLILVVFFAVNRSWFPATGYSPIADGVGNWLKTLFLPSLALAALPAAEIARQLRGSMIEVLERDYILAARAKGVKPRRIVLKHALKNAAIPPVTVLGFRLAQLLGGTVVIERVFVLPGLGQLTVESVLVRDYTALLGVVLMSAVIISLINLAVDASYMYFNPKLATA